MFGNRMFAAALILFMGGLLHAADFTVPAQKIVGAETPIALGELVTLSVSAPEKVPNLLSTVYEWKVFDGTQQKKFAVDAAGNIFFGAGLKEKKLLAVVAITHVYGVKDGNAYKEFATKTVVLSAVVSIGGGGEPEPGPGPGPQPKPDDPTFDDGKYKLAKFAYDNAPQGRSQDAKALAASFRGIATQIGAGALKDPEAILKATKDANAKALGQQGSAWESWFVALQDKLFELSESGTLSSPEDFRTAWVELTAGLDKVK